MSATRQFCSPTFQAKHGMDKALAVLQRRIDDTGWTVAGQVFELQRCVGNGPWFTAARGLSAARQYMALAPVGATRNYFRLLVMF